MIRKEIVMIAGVTFVTVLYKTNTLKFTFEAEWLLGGKKLWGRANLSQTEDVQTPESDGAKAIVETKVKEVCPVYDGLTETVVTGQVYKVKFSDIAVVRQSVEELRVILDIMAKPDKYKDIGCVFPIRYLIIGPSETGKTLHSMALLGETEALFGLNSITFIDGKTFKKKMSDKSDDNAVKEIFKTAKKNALSAAHLIVIDNIDEFDDKRDLNLELSNLSNKDSIIVIMTADEVGSSKFMKEANCTKINVDPMTAYIKHREDILKLHLSKTTLGPDIDVSWLAMRTERSTAADLAKLASNAARYAAYRGKNSLTQDDLEWVYKMYNMPTEKLKTEIPINDQESTAFHECGHAAMLHLQDGKYSNYLEFLTIEPHCDYLGVTKRFSRYECASHKETRNELIEYIDICLGGRAAEEIMYGKDNISTGISSDMSKASMITRQVHILSDKAGLYCEGTLLESDARKNLLTSEANKLLYMRYDHVLKTLRDHWPALERTAHLLLERKILTGEEFKKEFDRVVSLPPRQLTAAKIMNTNDQI